MGLTFWIKQNFVAIQIGFLILVVVVFWKIVGGRPKSQFKVRESDRLKVKGTDQGRDQLAHQRKKPIAPPLLSGIVIDGPPHVVLQIEQDASADEIRKAFKKLMKQYHPDKVPNSSKAAWKEAQKIAAAITAAKDKMLDDLEQKKF